MRQARLGLVLAILYVAASGLYVLSLPTAEACYESGRGVEISHRYCVGGDVAPTPMRIVGMHRALAAGALLLALAGVGRTVLAIRLARSRPAG